MSLWGGRFSQQPDQVMQNLSRSVQFDYRLAPYDVLINIENVKNLIDLGVIKNGNGEVVLAGLKALLAEINSGTFQIIDSDEDIHSAVERNLISKIGEIGGSIRAGRSRNDLVASAFKLYIYKEFEHLFEEVKKLTIALLSQAEKMEGVISPGFTHLQHAQPVAFSQELSKHCYALIRDCEQINNWRIQNAYLPFGSGALSGSSLIAYPENIAKALGMKDSVQNSIDGVSDRDFVASALFIMTMIGIHLSKMGEEFILYSSTEFSWATLPDAFSTGSSIMPQKKNPDVAELARGKSGRLIGNLAGFLATLKALPFAYNRDLQEDKEPIFDSFNTLNLLLPAMTGLVLGMKFHPEKISAKVTAGYSLATEIADYLSLKQVPFNQAHEIAGKVVKYAESQGLELSDLKTSDLQSIDTRLDEDLLVKLTPQGALNSRTSKLSSGPNAVKQQLNTLRNTLEQLNLSIIS